MLRDKASGTDLAGYWTAQMVGAALAAFIGFTVTVGAYAVGGISAGAFNP